MVIVATAIECFSSQHAAELAVNALPEKKVKKRALNIFYAFNHKRKKY